MNFIPEERDEMVELAEAGGQEGTELQCMECSTTFSEEEPSADTECPNCGGTDIELA